MQRKHSYFVYILTNYEETTFYIGVTNSLIRRTNEHKLHINKGFSDKYNLRKLVYYEYYDSNILAINREKQLKNWHREWKLNLIKSMNPTLRDLSDEFAEFDE